MKLNRTIFSFIGIALATIGCAQKKDYSTMSTSIYDYSIKSISGDSIHLSDFKGKKLLLVNVASECGFTPQYKGLQQLHETYGADVVVLGLPCNQFGGQEPGSHTQIASFCEKNFGVSFALTEKIDVKGDGQHPIYSWLTNKELNGSKSSSVKWNFQKYLIDENGKLVDVYYSTTDPMSAAITKHLKKG